MTRLLLLLVLVSSGAGARSPGFSGAGALEYARRAVAFGPRPAGSAAIGKLQAYLRAQLSPLGCELAEDAFTAQTPIGPVPMRNIIARFHGSSGRIVAVTGHYDTKAIPGLRFVGANDGGSSTGFLLELARVLARAPRKNDLWLVWLDGEEAFGEWSDTNGAYGSRHLAGKWAADGTLRRLKALINVDMIGDRDLDLLNDENSSARLRQLIWGIASRFGFSKCFLTEPGSILDDHVPFRQHGVEAVDLIDFTYGPHNAWWHTEQDTPDKLSADSFSVVGMVVQETLRALEQ